MSKSPHSYIRCFVQKILSNEDVVTILAELGITPRESRVYLNLVKLGCSNLTEISRSTELCRGDVFRIMRSLQDKNLVFKHITSPTKFEVVPIQDALLMLVHTKEYEFVEAQRSARELIEKLGTGSTSTETLKEPHVVMVPEKQLWRFSGPMINLAKKENCAYLSLKSFYTVLNSPVSRKPHINCAKRGVRNRWIIENPQNDILNTKLFKPFTKLPSVEIRYSTQPVQVNLFLCDQEQAFFTTVIGTNVGEHPNIWTNNPCVVEMAQDFFEKKWKEGA
jgi:sugar-specific transcriptional regulator TrmB